MSKFNKAHEHNDHFQVSPSLQSLVAKAIELSSIPIERSLEVGCGQGLQLLGFNISSFFGIDISDTAIKKATHNFPNIEFKVLSSLELDLLEGEFDLILDSHHIHYLNSKNEVEHYLGLVYQKLSLGGVFCMEAMISHKNLVIDDLDVCVLDAMEYEKLFIEKGFRITYLMIPSGRKIIADKKRRAALSSDPDVLLVIATKEDVAKAY